MEIFSPLTQNNKTTKIKTISSEFISSVYKGGFEIDTNSFFEGIESVDLYECNETGYKFFYPYNVTGDGKFYEDLQKFEWYYMPWKWEHQQTASLLKPGMNVLEIGPVALKQINKVIRMKSGQYNNLPCKNIRINVKDKITTKNIKTT